MPTGSKPNDNVYQGDLCIGFYGSDMEIYLQRCPECGRENYAMSVASGKCAWCGFDANKKEEDQK